MNNYAEFGYPPMADSSQWSPPQGASNDAHCSGDARRDASDYSAWEAGQTWEALAPELKPSAPVFVPAADQPTQMKQASTNPTQQEAATSTPMKQVVTPTKQPDTEAEASNPWLSSRRFNVGVKVKVNGLNYQSRRACT